MNKILPIVLLFVLALYFFYKEKPKLAPIISDKNTTISFIQQEQNETEVEISDFQDNMSEEEYDTNEEQASQTLDEDEADLDTAIASLNELLARLKGKEEKRVFKGFNPYISEKELSTNSLPAVQYFALESVPQTPELTRKDLSFARQGKMLAKRLFEANANGNFLWQNKPNWELWRKKGGANTHALISGIFYLYQNDDDTGYLSDELGISLQKNRKNAYFLSIITPTHYTNKPIQDFKSVDDYFIFKVGSNKFIIAYLFNRDFTKWWECELTANGLKSKAINSQGFELFSNDTNAYEMRLSEDGVN